MSIKKKLNKYIIFSVFIVPTVFGAYPAAKKPLFHGNEIQIKRKNDVTTGLEGLGGFGSRTRSYPTVIAVKRTPRATTKLNVTLYSEHHRGEEIKDSPLSTLKALPPSLESLILHGHEQDISLSNASIRALSLRCRSLKKLTFPKPYGEAFLFKNIEALQALDHLAHLETLDLHTHLLIDRALKLPKNLKALAFRDVEFKNLKTLKRTLKRLPSLTSLTLDGGKAGPTRFGQEEVSGLLKFLSPKTYSLSLGRLKGEIDLRSFADYFKQRPNTSLKRLSLTTPFRIAPESIIERKNIQPLFSKLESFSLTFTERLADTFPQNPLALFSDLALKDSTIRNLRLVGFAPGYYGVEELKGLLNILHRPNLEHLVLDGASSIVFLDPKFQEAYGEKLNQSSFFKSFGYICTSLGKDAEFLSKIFQKAPIETFWVTSGRGSWFDYSSIKPDSSKISIVQSILENPHLRTLELSRGNILAEDVISLFSKKGLEKIHLTTVSIRKDLTLQGVRNFLESFKKEPEKFCSPLKDAIMNNPSLKSIHCIGEIFTSPVVKNMFRSIQEELAPTGRSLHIAWEE